MSPISNEYAGNRSPAASMVPGECPRERPPVTPRVRWRCVRRRAGGVAVIAAALLAAGCATSPRPDDGAGRTAGTAGRAGVSHDAAEGTGAAIPAEVKEQYAEALALIEAQAYEEAQALLEGVIATAPQLAGPRINLGIVLARREALEQAQAALLGAIEQRADAAEAWNELGVVYRRMGRFLSARDAYERALELSPEYATAHFNLGVLLDLYLREPAEALAHYQQYRDLAREPDDQVETWIADLSRRVEATERTAGVVDEKL